MPEGVSPFIPILAGSLLALGCIFGVFRNFRHKRTIDDMPTSRTQGVFIGLTELKGSAESEAPLTSYLAGVRCVYYGWNIEEHWSRTVTETYTDAKGRTHTRTRRESGWKTVASGGESIPFYLKDDTGIIRIVPAKARIQALNVFDETHGRESSLYYGKGPLREVPHSDHRRRFREMAIPLHTGLYVVGQAREREDTAAAEIAYDKNASLFLISTRTEKQISSGYGRWSWFFWVLGLVLLLGSVAAAGALGGIFYALPWPAFPVAAAAYLAVSGLIWLWMSYNSLINLHHRVEQGWSQVEVQLKRRNDLIPSLVRVVEGYRAHERETQELVAGLRRQMEATPPGKPGPDFRGVASLIRLTIERYPELKADENFLKLQRALVDTEQRIALARDYYNEIATFYNTRLEIIPERYLAALARLHPQALLGAADFERAPVAVRLAD